MNSNNQEAIENGLVVLTNECYSRSKDGGWWTNLETGEDLELTVERALSKVALIHSEVSEALEGFRKDTMDDHLPHRKMAEVELADAIIRIFDLAGKAKFDLAGAVIEKLEYNSKRLDHQIENRKKDGGKKA